MTTHGLDRSEPEFAEPVLDRAFFESVTMGDAGLQKEVIKLLQSQLDEAIVAIPTLASKEDWKLELHRLRGAALAVGARELASYLNVLERGPLPIVRGECDRVVSRIAILAARFRTGTQNYG